MQCNAPHALAVLATKVVKTLQMFGRVLSLVLNDYYARISTRHAIHTTMDAQSSTNDDTVKPDSRSSLPASPSHQSTTPRDTGVTNIVSDFAARQGGSIAFTPENPLSAGELAEQLSPGSRAQSAEIGLQPPEPALLRPERPILPSFATEEEERASVITLLLREAVASRTSTNPITVPGSTHQERESHDHEMKEHAQTMNERPMSSEPSQSNDAIVDLHGSKESVAETSLNAAWIKTEDPNRYRHVITGAIYLNGKKAPQFTGPGAQDIPDGWQARLPDITQERWSYTHNATRINHMDPVSLPKATLENFRVASTYGEIPHDCHALLLDDGRIAYAPGTHNPRYPPTWYTLEHSKALESRVRAYLDSCETRSGPAKAILFTESRREPVGLDGLELSKLSGTLMINDMDNAWIRSLAASGGADMLDLLVLHALGQRTKRVAIDVDAKNQAQTLTKLLWTGFKRNSHCHVLYDKFSRTLRVWDSITSRMETPLADQNVHVSARRITSDLCECPRTFY